MAPSNGSNQPPPKSTKKNGHSKGDRRYVLSARAQAALMWILEEIIDKTLSDASQLAEAAGKQRVELAEVEKALKMLCERYHARWSSSTSSSKAPNKKSSNSNTDSKKRSSS